MQPKKIAEKILEIVPKHGGAHKFRTMTLGDAEALGSLAEMLAQLVLETGHEGRNEGVEFTPTEGHFLIVSGDDDIGPIGCMDSPSGEDFIHAEREDPGVTFKAVSPDACPVCNHE